MRLIKGFLLIESLIALLILGMLGGILYRYRIICSLSVHQIDLKSRVIFEVGDLMEHVMMKQTVPLKGTLPCGIAYTIDEKNVFLSIGKQKIRAIDCTILVNWQEAMGKKRTYFLSTCFGA